MPVPPRALATIALLALAGLVAGCAGGDGADGAAEGAGGASVVVTTSILGDIAGDVLADTDARIEVLMPPGADPHGYQPSAADGVALREADLVVAIGLDLEEGLVDTLAAAEEDGVEVLEVGALVDPVAYGAIGHADAHGHADDDAAADEHADEEEHAEDEEHADDEHAEDDEHTGLDPHVWLDPVRAGAMAQEIAAAYATVDPAAGDAVQAAADAYEQTMAALDEELAAQVASLPEGQRQLVTNHDALGYLAARYDLAVVATVLPGTSADVDVTAEAFTELVELLGETGIPAVFAETTSPDRLARALAEEVPGVEVVELYTGALGEPGSGADTLEGMLRTDVERIVAALG